MTSSAAISSIIKFKIKKEEEKRGSSDDGNGVKIFFFSSGLWTIRDYRRSEEPGHKLA